jgi:MFS family permease
MFVTNLIKVGGCALMFMHVHPLAAYAVVGFGAAAYSPAKYGILTELLPAEKLVAANGWIEGLTVSSIIPPFSVAHWWLRMCPRLYSVLDSC